MMESMKKIVTGQGLEEKGDETGDRVAELGKAEKYEGSMTPVNNPTEGNRKGKETADCSDILCGNDIVNTLSIVCSNGNTLPSLRIQSLHGGRGGSNKHC